MTDTTTVLKTDVLGRVKVSREHREALLDAFETSGLSGVAFARHHGVTYPTFATWMQKRRRERGLYPVAQPVDGEALKLTLAEVELPSVEAESPVVPPPSPPVCVEVVLPGGLTLRVPRDAAVSSVVELVNALRAC